MNDIATRVYNHSFRLDPIVRSLLDTDFYKFAMQQLIWWRHPNVDVTFRFVNRSNTIRIAADVDETELREQMDHARTVRLSRQQEIWLAGNTFYGRERIFAPDFLDWLKHFRLPEYSLERRGDEYHVEFAGKWAATTMWEIPFLAIVNELRARAKMRSFSKFELDVLYARAKARAWGKVERLRALKDKVGVLKIADFGTRRRHGFLWHRWVIEAMVDGLGPDIFTGTSNMHLAMEMGIEAIGTNGHELPMVYAALAGGDDEAVRRAPYQVLEDWAKLYYGNMRIVLPDCFGSTNFLRDAPDWVADWTGARPDSKDPITAGEELIAWWESKGRDPRQKLILFTDGMDVESIEQTALHFAGRVRLGYGWGTNLTNDFRGAPPNGDPMALGPASLVCKVVSANGLPCVKLSDNPAKATGPANEIDRYRRIFGTVGMVAHPVEV